MVRPRILFAIAAVFLLTACRTPAPSPPTADVFTDAPWLVTPDPEETAPRPKPQDAWWEDIGDTVLTGLIETALEENRDLHAARARLRRARALRDESRADRRPQLSATAGVFEVRSIQADGDSATLTEWDAGLSLDWELDVLGRLGSGVLAAEARRNIEAERGRDLILDLTAEVALAYHELFGIQRQITITRQNRDLLLKTLELAQGLFDAGETSEFDVVRARGQLQLIEARLPELDAAYHNTAIRLATLTGRRTATLLADLPSTGESPPLPDPHLPEIESERIQQRPDVRAAMFALEAAAADHQAARLDRFPRFSLLGDAGRRTDSASGLGDSDNDRYRVGLALDWPVWEGGALRARQDIRNAELEEALALYEQQILRAFADVEAALIRHLREQDVAERLRRAESSTRRAVELARDLYNAGEETFLAVLDAERELISVQDRLVISETNVILNRIRLHRTLGGTLGSTLNTP